MILKELRPQTRTLLGQSNNRVIVSKQRFRLAVECERLRLYRIQSLFSVLLISLQDFQESGLRALEGVLESHLAPIDTAGMTSNRQVGVILPGIDIDEAQRVADSIAADCRAAKCEVRIRILRVPEDDVEGEIGATASEQSEEELVSVDTTGATALFAMPLPIWKRCMDVAIASFVLLVTSPILLACGLLVKLTSPGNVFFAQERVGHGGKTFRIFKLRTMVAGAEKRVDELRHLSEQDGPAFKLTSDPRVTPIGRFLRRFSIDELPQLWNVLRGDMSLVGPRPLPTAESANLAFWQRERLDVAPGITGLWQVSGRNSLRFDEWMHLDIQYARGLSLLTDIQILFRTVPAVLSCRGAS